MTFSWFFSEKARKDEDERRRKFYEDHKDDPDYRFDENMRCTEKIVRDPYMTRKEWKEFIKELQK